MTHDDSHIYLLLPGPVEVRREILDAQAEWMIGHRSAAFADLFGRLQDKLKRAFFTSSRVYVSGSSGTGLWEAASRNCVRDDGKILHLVNGAFSERWATVSRANGKQADVLEVEWGQAHSPDMLEERLTQDRYDAVAVVQNESSTGVLNPIKDLAAVTRRYEDTLVLVDAVSGFAGAELRFDEWGLDFVLTSTQKALALPPGMALAACSDRVLKRAEQVAYRGYYFDLLEMEKLIAKNHTPATPPISLMFAADQQLDSILAEGMENRWARHLQLRDMAIRWAGEREFGLFAQDGYRSPTLTAVANTWGIDLDALGTFMRERHFAIDKGYGKVKGTTFRIAHMGDMTFEVLEKVLDLYDEFLGGAASSSG